MNHSVPGHKPNTSQLIRIGFSFLVTVLLMCLLSKRGDLFHVGDAAVLLLGLLSVIGLQIALYRKQDLTDPPSNPPLCLYFWATTFLVMYLSAGVADNNWFFFPRWRIDGKGLGASWLLRALGITSVLSLLLYFHPRILKTRVFAAFAIMVMLACGYFLEKETGFKPLYRVDHPSFQYRFASFMETFPQPDFYDPHWNGGKPVPYLVASGTWALALLWYPLLKIFSIKQLYTPLIAVTFMILVPWIGYVATRLMGGNRRAGWISFLLFMVPGQRYFTHILHYGTTPSIFCLCLFPLILALFWKLLHAEKRRQLALISLALTSVSALALCWPGALLPGIPLLIALLSMTPQWTPGRVIWMSICAGTLILLLHPLAMVPIRYSPINQFLGYQESKHIPEMWENGLHQLSGLLQGVHPLIVIFGATVGLLDSNRMRGIFMAVFIFSAGILAGWGEEFSPLLQWERLIIPATLVAALASGIAVESFLTHFESLPASKNKILSATGIAWVMSLLILGGYMGTKIYSNQSQMDFQTMPEHTKELVHWLRNEVPEDGRILIAGKAVHGYGGAKVANMPLLTGREMMASDYYGFSPKLVEYQYPPKNVRAKGPDGVFRFMALYNVTHVMTYHQGWKDAFERHPEYYTPRYENGRVKVYQVKRPSSMFLKGHGSIDADFRRINAHLDANQDQVILKYNWNKDFVTEPPAEIFPVDQEFGIRLIGIRPHGLTQITLEHRP
ncbi:hypothetical protein P0Y35_16975 [Kiritimatiellaeota bacterium B1221]|nr:hypothetical protein [Kiritimatiellaeota bacterium B1221]